MPENNIQTGKYSNDKKLETSEDIRGKKYNKKKNAMLALQI
jgi:hypothetical protein